MTTKPIFHRGDTTDGDEENTMGAFRAATARNRGFEFDVHPTLSATFAVIHDATWYRTCRASTIPGPDPETQRVAKTTQTQVDLIRTKGLAPIPSLRQVLGLVDTFTGSPVLIDWKMADTWPDSMYPLLDQRIVDAGAQNRHFLFSSDLDEIAKVRSLCPNVRISYRPVGATPYNVQSTIDLGAGAIQPELASLTQQVVDDFQAAGLRVICQDRDIDSPDDVDRARELGVDYMLINAGKWDRWTA